MRIVIIEREEGEYTDGNNQYNLIEVADGSKLATKKPIVEAESSDAYAKSQGWDKTEEEDSF